MALIILFDKYDLPISDWGRQINFKIFNETDLSPFDATFANGNSVLKTFDKHGNQLINDINIVWDTQNKGIGHFAYTNQFRPSTPGDYYLCVQMWDNAGPPPNQQTSTGLRRIVFTPQPSEF